MNDKPSIDFSLLLASSVHDIKNSLSMLLNSLEEIIASEAGNTKLNKNFSILHSEAARINHALIHLLGTYRLDNNQLKVASDEVFVLDFLEEQVASHQLLFDINKVQIHVDCDEALTAYFDEKLIAGVITNILVNCTKYTENTITISARPQQSGIQITIQDNGSGYPDAIINSLSNEERGVDFESGSTNLGLHFAAEIAQLHNCKDQVGAIHLSNNETGGLFSLYLP